MPAPVQLSPHKSGDYWPGLPSFSIEVDGEPLDLTGAVVLMQFKRFPADSAAALALTSAGEGAKIVIGEDPTEGVFSVSGQTITLPPALYYWDVQTTISGQPKTWVGGTWKITPDVSR